MRHGDDCAMYETRTRFGAKKISWRDDTCNDEDEITASHIPVIKLDECSGLDFNEPANLVSCGHGENRTMYGFWWASFKLQKIPEENAQWNNNDEYGFTSFLGMEWSGCKRAAITLSHAVMAMAVPCAPKSTIRCNEIWTLKSCRKDDDEQEGSTNTWNVKCENLTTATWASQSR